MDIELLDKLFQIKERTKAQNLEISDLLQQIKFFKNYATSGKVEEINSIISKGKLKKYQKDHCLIELDVKNEYFYIILSGQVGFYIPKPKKGKEETKQRQYTKIEKQRDALFLVKIFKKGESFGEISLIYDRGSDGSMYCMEDTYCLLLCKKDFMEIIGESEKNSVAKEVEFLQQHPLFENWSFNLLRLLYLFSQKMNYNKNEVVFLQDQKPTHIYIVKKGEFAIYRNFKDQQKQNESNQNTEKDENQGENDIDGSDQQDNLKLKFEKDKKLKLAVMGEGEIFGEEDILMKQNRSFSVVCESYIGAQLIMIKTKVFKLSIMADIGSSTYIKKRLKQKNYNHQLRFESVSTFLKEYKDFFVEGTNDKKQQQNQNEETKNGNNGISSTVNQDLISNKSGKRGSYELSSSQIQPIQGFLSPPGALSTDKNTLNFNTNQPTSNQRRRSFFQSSCNEEEDKMKKNIDLFDHFSQFENKIYKNEKYRISSQQVQQKIQTIPNKILQKEQSNTHHRSSIQIMAPQNNNLTKSLMPISQVEDSQTTQTANTFTSHLSEFHFNQTNSLNNLNSLTNINSQTNLNSGRDSIYKININNLISPKSQIQNQTNSNDTVASKFKHRASAQFYYKPSQNNSEEKRISIDLQLIKAESQPSNLSLQKPINNQTLDISSDANKINQSRKLSNFHVAAPQIFKSNDSTQQDIHQTQGLQSSLTNLTRKQSEQISKSGLLNQNLQEQQQANQDSQQTDYKKNQNQIYLMQQLKNHDQNKTANQNYIDHTMSKEKIAMSNSQQFLQNMSQNTPQNISYNPEMTESQTPSNLIRNNQRIINPTRILKPQSKFVNVDSNSLSPTKYTVQQQQLGINGYYNYIDNTISMTSSLINDQKKFAKKQHLQQLLGKQKPMSANKNRGNFSASAIIPTSTTQQQIQVYTQPQENLQNNSVQEKMYSTQKYQSQQVERHENNNFIKQTKDDIGLISDKNQENQFKGRSQQKKRTKTFKNSIFTDNFQKTFQQNLHQIQYRILQKKHKVQEIQQSIAKHIQDSTIKNFLEENTLFRSKYENNKQKQKQPQAKSEPQLVALKQMLKNQLNYSPEDIELGLSQLQKSQPISQRPQTQNINRKLIPNELNNQYPQSEEFLHQDLYLNEQKSPKYRSVIELPRTSIVYGVQSQSKQQQQQQLYKFQQFNNSNQQLDYKSQEDQELKNFSITPNDKTGTVHIKSLSSLNCLPTFGNSHQQTDIFNFQQKSPNSQELRLSITNFNNKFNKSQKIENTQKQINQKEQIQQFNKSKIMNNQRIHQKNIQN